jgi:hypothetical protein
MTTHTGGRVAVAAGQRPAVAQCATGHDPAVRCRTTVRVQSYFAAPASLTS